MSLEELLKRVDESSGPDWELDGLLYGMARNLTPRDTFITIDNFQFVHPDDDAKSYYVAICMVPAYTASLDSALALVEEKLPGWRWTRALDGQITLWMPAGTTLSAQRGRQPLLATDALTMTGALLRALISQKDGVE